jgi:hypothetical protein
MKDVLDFAFQINSVVISRCNALLSYAGSQKRAAFHRWQMENCGVVPSLSIPVCNLHFLGALFCAILTWSEMTSAKTPRAKQAHKT